EAVTQRRQIVYAPFLPGAQLEILDEDIGALEQLEQHLPSRIAAEVEGEVLHVSIQAQVIGCDVVDEGRAIRTRVVAPKGFDLYDFCAVVAQDLTRVGAGQNARRVDHHGTGERAA